MIDLLAPFEVETRSESERGVPWSGSPEVVDGASSNQGFMTLMVDPATDEARDVARGGAGRGKFRARPLRTACVEDPVVARALLGLETGSRVLMGAGCGCNVLDVLLDGPSEIVAVATEPTGAALLELKLALIRRGWFEDLWRIFGEGRHEEFRRLLALCDDPISADALQLLALWGRYVEGTEPGHRRSFHDQSWAGRGVRAFWRLLRRHEPELWTEVLGIARASSLVEQRRRFLELEPVLKTGLRHWLEGGGRADVLLGAVHAGTEAIDGADPGAVPERIWARVRHLATEIPLACNYFWQLELEGHYRPACCPAYLRRENFETLRRRLGRVSIVRGEGAEFPGKAEGGYTHIVVPGLLDGRGAEAALWNLLLRRSRQGTRILFRTLASEAPVLPQHLTGRLRFQSARAAVLARLDRTAGFGGLHLAEVR